MIQDIKQAITQGRYSQAVELANNALSQALDEKQRIDIHYMLVVAHRLSKQLDAALKSSEQLTQLAPNHGRNFQEQGHIHLAQGNKKQAAIAFYKAVQLNPTLIVSWRALKTLYQETGNTQAVSLAEAQLSYLENLPRAIVGARDLMHEGDLIQADQVCRQFLQQEKHHAEGLFLLAEIGIQMKVYSEAEFLLESCLELYPEHQGAGLAHLKLLSKMGKFEQARQLAEKLLKLNPNNPAVITAKASSLVGIGEIDQAIDIYQQLLAEQDDQPGVHLLLGHALKAQGNFTDAIVSYQNAYRFKPDFGDAYWSLANTKTYRFTDEEIATMSKWVEASEIQTEDKIHMLFALGKAQEDRKNFDASFNAYEKGNALKQQTLGYDPIFIEKQVDAQIQQCTAALFNKFEKAGCTRPDPIFIVGLPRAGSTLLEQILASHSQVDGTMELHNILGLVSRLRGHKNQYPEVLHQLDANYFARFGEQFLEETQIYRKQAPLFIDKMPNNFLHIGLIKLILPKAKIIDARRDPMACCFSGFKQLFGEGQEFSYSLENIGRYYQAYLKLMQHWDEVLPGAVLRVQHEDVVNDLETQVRRILDYCDLPFEQACLDFHKTKRTIKTPSSEQVRQPIYRSGLEQWKHFEAHLSPLKEALTHTTP
ncbi:tetratricopeptide repeat-containing sulfotransferase family protein [Alteromonas sp. a30]|uniref:tetratricopeptide repeat-containing sulfotransferase family protein n=1 Tax=Alteromonas sp. a30 TaxID=2730917 RepID=UPI0022829B28|nr:tetratricopeptide repeat-containing sulfotransferase family protein [Alteromonas sp. a30]MCY7295039.1 tetratricopeptide repeat protein [Alteromonas sp. a30]